MGRGPSKPKNNGRVVEFNSYEAILVKKALESAVESTRKVAAWPEAVPFSQDFAVETLQKAYDKVTALVYFTNPDAVVTVPGVVGTAGSRTAARTVTASKAAENG